MTKTKKIKSRKCSSVAVRDFAIEVSEAEKQFVEDKIKGLWKYLSVQHIKCIIIDNNNRILLYIYR